MAAATHLTVQTAPISALKSSHSDSSLLDNYREDYELRHRQSSEREATSSEEGAEDEVIEAEKTER